MRNFYLFLALTLVTLTQAQTITFGDVRLKNKLLYADVDNATAIDSNGNQIKIDANGNNEIEVAEAQQVYQLDLNVVPTVLANTYNSISGLQHFVNLRKLVMHFYYNSTISFAAFPLLEDVTFTGSTQTTSISLAGIPNLKKLKITGNPAITALDFSQVPLLEYLNCKANLISALNVSMLTQLKELTCNNNVLTTLTLTGLTQLTRLECHVNKMTTLNLAGNPLLTYVNCSGMDYDMTALNITGLNQLAYLDCSSNNLTTLSLPTNTALKYLYAALNKFVSLDLSAAHGLLELDCMQASSNEFLTTLNLTGCSNLQKLTADYTKLSTVNLSPYTQLTDLSLKSCVFMTSLNISGLSQLTYLNIDRCTALNTFTFTQLPELRSISFKYASLTRLDMEYSPLLTTVYGDYSAVNFVNLSNSTNLYNLGLNSCPNLKWLLLKNGRGWYTNSYAFNSPSLEYLCVDENRFAEYQQYLTQFNLTQCQINSYCSFHPGGIYYDIMGTNRIDTDANGCSIADPVYPNLKLKVTNGTNTAYIITKADGSYSIPVQTGNTVITPMPEDSDYFTFSPPNATVNFDTAVSPYNLSFCYTTSGIKTDVQVMLMPVSVARPGFDATYKLIYKNKGNQIANGSVSVIFPDNTVDLISAVPAASQSGATLTWNYTNLNIMETREVALTFNVNSPGETPAVNNGDVLTYSANVTTANVDINTLNNTFNLNQTVTGSYDPNDKTCLQGSTVASSVIGNYVHYLIRFENTGTYMAENIVVTDVIDATKFDISTLQPLLGSHPYITRIVGSKVEFIFENINLPFNDANNDGYIMFKVKTKSSLGIGSTFSNLANIFFDYNLPIVTNTASSLISALHTNDFEFGDYFSLYPNPANDFLRIESRSNMSPTSFEVYAIDGKLIMAVPQDTTSVDVSSLSAGLYFIKVNTEKGTATARFIKQ
jgi:hypothetical protein